MNDIKPFIKQQLPVKKIRYKPIAVVMGKTGAGKTTLINILCETQHEAGDGVESFTRNLFLNDVSWGNYAFSLIDTPGTDNPTETYKHAYLLKHALTTLEINTIFIVIKYDNRFKNIIDNYLEVEQPVYNYTNKIVVMISHWDLTKTPNMSYCEICELFQQNCPKVSNLIFYSEQSSVMEITNLMYSCISNMEKEKLKITEEEFLLKFNIYEMRGPMKVLFGEFKRYMESLKLQYIRLIESAQSQSPEDRDEVLHMTIVTFKEEMEKKLQEFRQKHNVVLEDLNYYAFCINIEKEHVKICDNFVEMVRSLMSYDLFDNQDPRNLIKRCPHCHLIWFKTEGCDGKTWCGNNGFKNPHDVKSKFYWKKYRIERIDGELQWTKNSIEPSVEKSIEYTSTTTLTTSEHRNNTKPKRIGCGKKFKWSDEPKIEDNLILELFAVKTIDQAKQLIQNGSFIEVRQNYESGIDLTFHS
jgi:GTPase SAR1 family protein